MAKRTSNKERVSRSVVVSRNPGSDENALNITEYFDGSISLSEENGDGWVYLYPDQIKALKEFFKSNKMPEPLRTMSIELGELGRLRAALAAAERERDEALGKLADAESERDEYKATRDTFYDNWRKSSAAFDEAHKSALKWMDKAIETRMTLDNVLEREKRSRRTIRALVVAARVTRLAAVGFAFIAGVGPRRVHGEIRFGIKQAKQAERDQAGKE